MPVTKTGKGGTRKINRMSRKASHIKYNAEGRHDKNKAKKIAKSNRKIKRTKKTEEELKCLTWERGLGKVDIIYEKNRQQALRKRK